MLVENEDRDIIEEQKEENAKIDQQPIDVDPDIIYMDDPFKKAVNNKYFNQFRMQRIANNRRLIITKIILENFKSYHGRREIGPFHKVI